MNCKQANENIGIREILESFSLFPSKETRKNCAFYYALDRNERTPSLLVNFTKNCAYDFGSGTNYDNVSIVQVVKGCSVPEALEYLARFDFSFPKQKPNLVPDNLKAEEELKSYEITNITGVVHPALLQYLRDRKLLQVKSEVSEIHYELNGKNYFGIGFKNDSGGYEVRNPHIKICLGKKDITTIKNNSDTVRVFEGFTDYLSFRILEKSLEKNPSDYLVLNSVSMVRRAADLLKPYTAVELYLDNDRGGSEATKKLNGEFPDAEDCRLLYKNFKDLNEFLTAAEVSERRCKKSGR